MPWTYKRNKFTSNVYFSFLLFTTASLSDFLMCREKNSEAPILVFSNLLFVCTETSV
uniref:Uncharacterized protein n=1 Tax=Rhizophora mucronata TaxID=61149 RepID=A0A2P2P9W9_RHIMU